MRKNEKRKGKESRMKREVKVDNVKRKAGNKERQKIKKQCIVVFFLLNIDVVRWFHFALKSNI